MYKVLTVLLTVLILSACSPTEDRTSNYDLPSELSDCKVYYVSNNELKRNLTIVRCPNSNTTTQYKDGKVVSTTTVN